MAEPKHFLDLDQVDPKTLRQILDRGKAMKQQRANGGHDKPLAGKTLAMIFEALDAHPQSLSRHSELGGQTIMLEAPTPSSAAARPLPNLARVLSRTSTSS
jgi:ornithine carbamoyltransferase